MAELHNLDPNRPNLCSALAQQRHVHLGRTRRGRAARSLGRLLVPLHARPAGAGRKTGRTRQLRLDRARLPLSRKRCSLIEVGQTDGLPKTQIKLCGGQGAN